MKDQRWNRVITEDGEILSFFPEGWEFKAYALGIPKKIDPKYGDRFNWSSFDKKSKEKFTFLGCEKLSNMDVKPEVLSKLIYLSTFIDYHGKLMKTERTQMNKADLTDVLHISARKVADFLKDTNDFIFIDDIGRLSMNEKIFFRGKFKSSQMFNQYIRAFFDGIKSLYDSVKPRQHKQLGYIFMLLPYLNRTYNVLCHPDDVLETDGKLIRTIGFGEFCDLIGYDRHNANQLKTAYKKIKFPDNDGVYRDFLRIIDEYDKIYVNPTLFYAGSYEERVKLLDTLFS